MRRSLYTGLIALSSLLCAPALQAEVYRFGVDVASSASTSDLPVVRSLGEAKINQTAVPLYGLTMASPVDDAQLNDGILPTKAFQAAMTPEQAEQLALYAHSYGWLPVPRAWVLRQGAVGANGSESLLFAPRQGSGYLKFDHTSACVGCAQSRAALFFPEAKKDAVANEFLFYTATDVPISTVRLRPHLMAYQAQKQGMRIDGVAFYDARSDLPFWQVEISLPPAQQQLATPILNWFVSKQ